VRRPETKPIWTSSTFLVYTGGLTVLGGGLGALGYLSTQYPGDGSRSAWALLIYVVLYAVAYALRRRDRPLAAGIFAFVSVLAWAALVGLLFTWWGWTNSAAANSFQQWSWARLAFELLILGAAVDARRRFRFPFIRLISAVVGWFFVIDLITKGGDFTLAVTLIVGLAYLAWGTLHRTPSSFWLHVVAGPLIGVPILVWCHTSDADFAVVSIISLVYVAWAYSTGRSSWAVYGTIGFFIATVHYLVGSPTALAVNAFSGQAPDISAWSFPLAFGLLGFWLVGLGILGRRRPASVAEPAPTPE
jgi:hypothetical protein